MQSKKILIRKIAMGAAVLLVLGLAGVVITLAIAEADSESRLEQARLQRLEVVENAGRYLEELAPRITSVPVDPTTVGEIQAAYFAEVSQGDRLIWAVGPEGEFLFGVPRETFARLNQIWDEHQEELTDEGRFVDRADFLRRLARADQGELARRLREDEEPMGVVVTRLSSYSEDWLTFSTPLKSPEGASLGNLYLEVEAPNPPRRGVDHHVEGLVAVFGVAAGGSFTFLWFLLPTWVFVDARERGMRRATLWSFLVLISFLLGLVVYLIARPEVAGPLNCPACSREVNGGAFCPHCGQDLARAFCGTCRYPLKPDWVFCPSCRTEIAGGRAEAGDPLAGAATSEEA